MSVNALRWGLAGMLGLLASCAFITVNVYFPEKEVKKAFKALDDKYLKQYGERTPAEEKPPAGTEQQPEQQPKPEVKPQSRLEGDRSGFFPMTIAETVGGADSVESRFLIAG